MSETCVFCAIVRGEQPAAVVAADALTLAFIDLRQAVPGHVLVIPRAHLPDLRALDDATGAALMATTVRITRAVGEAFPNEGMSLWHSIGEAAFQEVPHLHLHVHPRQHGDGLLRIYPAEPHNLDLAERERLAARVRARLAAVASA
jgi:histidine triad (HIT) family protein